MPADADNFLPDAFCCLWALKVKAMYQVLVTRMLNLRMHCLAPASNLRHKPRMRIAQQKIDRSVTHTILKQMERSSQINTAKELWSKSLSGGKKSEPKIHHRQCWQHLKKDQQEKIGGKGWTNEGQAMCCNTSKLLLDEEEKNHHRKGEKQPSSGACF